VSIILILVTKDYGKKLPEFTINSNDKFLLLIYLGHLAFLALHFLKFPIFPNSSSGDFILHLKYSLQLINGEKNIINLGYYPGVEILIGSGLLLIGGEELIVMRKVICLIAGFMPLIIFNTGTRVFNNRRKAIICSLVYSFSSAFWYDSLYISGLYANILTNLIAISLVYLIINSTYKKSLKFYFLVFLSSISLILSHSTSVIFLVLSFIFIIIVRLRNRVVLSDYTRTVLFQSLPLVGVLFYPKILSRLKNILSGQYIQIEVRSSIFELFKPISPFFAYTSAYFGLILVMLSITGLAIILVRLKEGREFWGSFFCLWFLLTWILSLQGKQIWRFALLAKIPSIFLVGYLIEEVLISLKKIVLGQTEDYKSINLNYIGLSTLMLLIILISGGSLNYVSSNLSYNYTSQRQNSIFNSMMWISENTSNESVILAISEWEYIYLPQISQRGSNYLSVTRDYNVTQIEEYLKSNFDYLILSNSVIGLYDKEINFEEVWSNEIVTIFSDFS
jgi:hypothetical protein